MVRQIWYATDGNIWISGANFSTGIIGSNYTAIVKEISITGGGRPVDGVRCFGSGGNYYVFEKGQEMYEVSLTTVKQNNYLAKSLISGQSSTEPITLQGDTLRDPVNMLYQWHDRLDVSGAAFYCKMASAWCTGKEMSVSTDNSLEETFTFMCDPGNYQEQYSTNRVVSSMNLTL
jgi:hypothetical protein